MENSKIQHTIQNSSNKPPLWMPPGSVRAIITLSCLAIFFYMSIMGIEVSETFNTTVITVVAFYFGTRSNAMTEILNENANQIENTQLKGNSIQNRMGK